MVLAWVNVTFFAESYVDLNEPRLRVRNVCSLQFSPQEGQYRVFSDKTWPHLEHTKISVPNAYQYIFLT